MADFKSIYNQLCSKYNIQKQNSISGATIIYGHLDLANETISHDSCVVIGKIAESSNILLKISLDNCLLEESGLKTLLTGLSNNNSVTSLSLKGNAIRDSSILTKLIRNNKSITRISLEWNNLGLNVTSFTNFCEALEINNTLTHLDLRNNQLGVDHALYIGKMLGKNTSLTFLDLSFNNFGTDGAKKILAGIRNNRSLLKVSLLGNNIYDESLNEIEQQIARNCELSLQQNRYISSVDQLKNSLQHSEKEAARQKNLLENDLAAANSSITEIIRDSQHRLNSLKEELEAKSSEADTLNTKYETTSLLLMKEQEENKELYKNCNSLQNELVNLKEIHNQFVRKANEKETSNKNLHQSQIESLQYTISKNEVELEELESKLKESKNELFSLKEKVLFLENEIKALKCENEATLVTMKAEHKENVKKLEKGHNSQLKKHKYEWETKEEEMKKKMQSLELQKEEVERELRRSKSELSSEKEQHQTAINTLKQQMKNEQKVYLRGLDDKRRELERNRDELEEKLHAQIETCSNLTSANARFESKTHSMSNDITLLKAEIEGKESEIKVAEQKVLFSVKNQLDELEQLRSEKNSLKEKTLKMQREFEDQVKHLEDSLKKRDNLVLELKEKLNESQNEIVRMKQEENKRINMLQSAFVQYLNPTKS